MLSDAEVRTAAPGPKPYKLFDRDGLYVIVQPNGRRWWRLNYRFAGKAKTLSMGTYPEVSLKQARARVAEARRQIADGVNPSDLRKREKLRLADDFESVAREWHAKKSATWTEGNAAHVIRRMENWAFPWIGGQPVAELSAQDVLAVLRRIEGAGKLETAHRVRGYISASLRYAVVTGRAEHDVAAYLADALPAHKKQHRAAIIDPVALGGLLRAIDAFSGSFVVHTALRIAPYLFARPGELRQMRWAHLDLDAGLWSLPAEDMKSQRAHIVPLAPQVVASLRDLQPLTGQQPFVFPSRRGRGRPMSDNTLNAALRRLGYERSEVTAHGFRATARTLLEEELGYRPDLVELQIAHKVSHPLG